MGQFQDQMVNEVMFNSTRLIPGMKFMCGGTIVGVIMAGRQRDGN